MKKYVNIIVVAGLAYVLASCSAQVYAPVSHHVPLLKEKGELSMAFYTSTSGFSLQGAYALTDNIGIGSTLNYLYDETRNVEGGFQKHRYAEVSFIYSLNTIRFSPTVKQLFSREPIPERYIKLEFLGSAGLGSGESSGFDIYAEGSYSKISAQANVAFIYESYFIGVSPKLSYVSYYKYSVRDDDPQPIESNVNAFLWEPALFGGIRIGNVSLLTQFGFAKALGEEPSFNYSVSHFSIGIQVNLDT